MTRLRRVLDALRVLPYAPTYLAETLRRAARGGLVVREERWWRLASARHRDRLREPGGCDSSPAPYDNPAFPESSMRHSILPSSSCTRGEGP